MWIGAGKEGSNQISNLNAFNDIYIYMYNVHIPTSAKPRGGLRQIKPANPAECVCIFRIYMFIQE